MGETYEAWLGLSVDHVLPQSLIRTGWRREWIEDLTNKVTCCRHCNEFLNQFKVEEDAPEAVEAFFDIRDRVFKAKREWVTERHTRERAWYDRRR